MLLKLRHISEIYIIIDVFFVLYFFVTANYSINTGVRDSYKLNLYTRGPPDLKIDNIHYIVFNLT